MWTLDNNTSVAHGDLPMFKRQVGKLQTERSNSAFTMSPASVSSLTRLSVLQLYKQLMRYSHTVKVSCPDYFRERVRAEFINGKQLTAQDDIMKRIARGEALLRYKRIV